MWRSSVLGVLLLATATMSTQCQHSGATANVFAWGWDLVFGCGRAMPGFDLERPSEVEPPTSPGLRFQHLVADVKSCRVSWFTCTDKEIRFWRVCI